MGTAEGDWVTEHCGQRRCFSLSSCLGCRKETVQWRALQQARAMCSQPGTQESMGAEHGGARIRVGAAMLVAAKEVLQARVLASLKAALALSGASPVTVSKCRSWEVHLPVGRREWASRRCGSPTWDCFIWQTQAVWTCGSSLLGYSLPRH